MVCIVKELLIRTLGRPVLAYEELNTFVCDCESVVNYRPLTYITEDSQEVVLTSAMFLTENRRFSISDIFKLDAQNLKRGMNYIYDFLNDFR